MKTKLVPVSLVKELSDKNFYPDTKYPTIDVDAMLSEHPEVTHLQCLGVTEKYGIKRVSFLHPGRGLWLNLGVTKSQLKRIQKEIGV